MKTIKIGIALMAISCLGACSDGTSQNTNTSNNDGALFQTQTKALDDAKAIEKLLLDSANKRMHEIDELSTD